MSAMADVARALPPGLLLSLPIVLPLLGAAASMLLRRRTAQRVIGIGVLVVLLVDGLLLLARVDADGPLAVQAGDWAAPWGITLVADRFSALLLPVSVVVLLVVLVYALGQGTAESGGSTADQRLVRVVFHPAYLVLACGVCFAFLTGDLFNLFVAFEVMLTASYVLITLGTGPRGVRSAMTYVVVSLLASALFVATVGLVYAATGTVNLADLRGALGELPDGVRLSLSLLLLVVFGIKAALFPLYFWLPDSYPVAPAPVTAVFAGLLTKVGVYAVIRTQTLLFPEDTAVMGPVLIVVAGLTLVFGILGAIAQNEIKRVLSFTIVSHIGFMVMGLGFFTLAGVAGAVLYVVHHIVIQTTLFCVEGLVERLAGTGEMDRISGLAHRSPLIAALFALPALSLAGIPPFSGFVAKLALLQAGSSVGSWVIVGVAVATSLLTLYAMATVWGSAFWGRPTTPVEDPDPGDTLDVGVRVVPATMTAATAAVVVVGLAIPLAAGPLYALCARAAADLLSAEPYVTAVLGG